MSLRAAPCAGAACVFVRGALEFVGAAGSAENFPSSQSLRLAVEMTTLLNQTTLDGDGMLVSLEIEAADGKSDKSNAIFILFSAEANSSSGAATLLAAIRTPIGDVDTESKFIEDLQVSLGETEEFIRLSDSFTISLSKVVPLEAWGSDALPTPPALDDPTPNVRQVEPPATPSASTKTDGEKQEDLDTSQSVVIGASLGSVGFLLLVLGLFVAHRHAHSEAERRHASEAEPFLKHLPGPPEQVEAALCNIFTEFDADKTKKIDTSELLSLMEELLILNGYVLADTDLNIDVAKFIMRALDVDGDQTLSMDEFVRWTMEGLKRGKEDHAAFANGGDVQAMLAMFVSAIRTEVMLRVPSKKDKEKSTTKQQQKKQKPKKATETQQLVKKWG